MATRIVSTAIAGYVSSPILIISGKRLTTPSISGAVLITPTPSAAPPSSGIGPSIPFHSYNQGNGSPILATPLGTAFLCVWFVPTCAITTPISCSDIINSSSPPSRSGSENSIGITMIPTSASLSL